jgi:LysM repeat protein
MVNTEEALMISALQNQRIKRFPGHGLRPCRKNSPCEYPQKKKKISITFALKHTVIIAAIFLTLAYLFTSSQALHSLKVKTQTTPLKAEFALVVDIAAKPSSNLSLTTGIQSLPFSHKVRKGETIYGIAERYDLSVFDIIRANEINDPTKIQPGQLLRLSQPDYHDNWDGNSPLPEPLISVNKSTGQAPFQVDFTCHADLPEGSYLWDLGNWRFAFNRNPANTFQEPGLYTVKLKIYNKSGTTFSSNNLTIKVLPHKQQTDNHRFITLDQLNDTLNIRRLMDEMGAAGGYRVSQSPVLFKDAGEDRYLAVKGGYTRLGLQADNSFHSVYTFVSPIPSRHSWEPDINWYKTQFGTGIRGNCGPATVAMASYWSSGLDTPVTSIRSEIGMPHSNGAISFEHMFKPFQTRGVSYRLIELSAAENLKAIIDRGNIGIILINTAYIDRAAGDARTNFIGRYYRDITGHYVVVKGYTLDGRYFIVYDPIPSDWTSNRSRYKDGISMLGRNRYYSTTQIIRALKKPLVLEVKKN